MDRAAAAIRHTGFAELAAEGDKIDVERKAQMRRDFPLQPVHVARRAVAVFLRGPDPPEPPRDPPAVGVHRKNLASEGIHHHAPRDFFPDARQ